MATATAFPQMQDLSFTCPKVVGKVYVTTGPSGWPETFRREKLDAELAAFIATAAPTVEVIELVDMFIATRELGDNKEPIGWFTIVGFVARQLQLNPRTIPHTVGIAFWGQVVIAQTAQGAN